MVNNKYYSVLTTAVSPTQVRNESQNCNLTDEDQEFIIQNAGPSQKMNMLTVKDQNSFDIEEDNEIST